MCVLACECGFVCVCVSVHRYRDIKRGGVVKIKRHRERERKANRENKREIKVSSHIKFLLSQYNSYSDITTITFS